MRPPRIKMKAQGVWLTVLTVLMISRITPVEAFWRLLCKGTLATARIDPVVNYGEIAPHAHNIAGASNFGIFSETADLMASNCTSCEVTQDRSAYWTPALYFQHDNGSYELVPTQGGMTVYYFNDNVGFVNDTNGNPVPAITLTAFPPNFRMIAGNTSLRNFPYPIPDPPMSEWGPEDMTQAALGAKAIGFNCLNYYTPGFATEGALEYHYLRNKTFLDAECLQGVRFELEFPSCWDGVRLDSEDHKSHILYPTFIKTGDCPDGYNVRTPVMFFETIWQTSNFVNQSGQFVIANGDTEGYGYHGDFYSGWDQGFLQEAVNKCTNSSGLLEDCGLFDLQDDSISTSCRLNLPQELRFEDTQEPMASLPGDVSIASGPALAPKLQGQPVTGTTRPPPPTALPDASTHSQGSSGTAPSASSASLANTAPAQASATATPECSSAAMQSITTHVPGADTGDTMEILSTSTFTSGGHEVHLILYEEIVTVTESVGPAKKHRHRHARAHG